MKQKLKFLCCFLMAAVSVFGQKNTDQHKERLNEAMALFNLENPTESTDKKALELFTKLSKIRVDSKKEAEIAALASQKAGVIIQMNGSAVESKKAYQKSISLSDKYGLSDSLKFSTLLYLGGLYYTEFAFDSSYYFLSKAEKLYQKNEQLPEAGRLFNTLGVLYFETGDYRQSIPYFQKAIELRKGSESDDYALKVNLAFAHHQLSDSQTALKIYGDLEKEFPGEKELLLNMAAIYLDQNEELKAKEVIRRIEQRAESSSDPLFLKLKGELSLKNEDYQNALKYFQSSQNLHALTKGPIAGGLWMHLGEVWFQTGRFDKALIQFQKAIIALSTDFNDTAITANPSEFTDSYTSYLLMQAMGMKALTFKKLFGLRASDLFIKAASNSYESTLKLATTLSKKYNNEASRIDFTRRIHDYFTEYTDMLLASGNTAKAFQIADMGKAAVLSLSLSESQTQSMVPDSLLQKESFLNMKYSALLRRQTETREKPGDEITEVLLQISQVRRQISSYSMASEELYKTLTVKEIQQKLHSKEAYISLHEGAENDGIFIITNSGFSYQKLEQICTIDQKLTELKQSLNGIGAWGQKERERVKWLYRQLIMPIESLLENKQMLLISSDGLFHGIPFEVLMDDTGQYLIEKWAVSYLFNASFLNTTMAPKNDKILALAPFAEKTTGFPHLYLPASEHEVSALKADVFLNNTANKQAFLDTVSAYGLLHLATHAKAHDSNSDLSYIQFYPDSDTLSETRLYLHELSPGSLPGPLVFLSACESFGDDLLPGEGIRGLCYGFARAGASGIISSLWNAEDHSTAELANLFYYYLDNGNNAGVALQKARQAFLKAQAMARFHNPAFWSHLVYTGYAPYKTSVWENYQVALLLTLLLLLAFYYALKKRR